MMLKNFEDQQEDNVENMQRMGKLAIEYQKWVEEEMKHETTEKMMVASVGKVNPKRHLTDVTLHFSSKIQNFFLERRANYVKKYFGEFGINDKY